MSRMLKSLNSTMVRLKPKWKDKKMKYSWLSQFHYGSIKTNNDHVFIIRLNESQFHYGSIKTPAKLFLFLNHW